ncbi:hypothetical protein D3C87_1856920 [compost metagenome]
MEGRALAVGDEKGGGTRDRGARNVALALRAERFRGSRHRSRRLGHAFRLEIAAGDHNAQAGDAILQWRQRRLDRPLRAGMVVRVRPLHQVIG